MHEYIPDIYVRYTNGEEEIWEIKPADQTHLERNQAKWDAAKSICTPRNWKFEVYTERIDKLVVEVRNQKAFE